MRNYNQEIAERLASSSANLFISLDQNGILSIYHLGSIEQKIILLKYLERDINKTVDSMEQIQKTPPFSEERGN